MITDCVSGIDLDSRGLRWLKHGTYFGGYYIPLKELICSWAIIAVG